MRGKIKQLKNANTQQKTRKTDPTTTTTIVAAAGWQAWPGNKLTMRQNVRQKKME